MNVTPAEFPTSVTLGQQKASPDAPVPTPQEVAPDAAVTDKPLSPAFAALARKEKQMQKDREAFKAEREAHEAEKANFIPKAKLRENLLSVLQEEGFTPDQLAQMILSGPGPQDTALAQLKAEIAELRAGHQKTLTTFEESQKKQYDTAVAQIRTDVTRLVETNADYETIKEMGAAEDVVKLIEDTFNTEGKLLSVEEASKQVEDQLVEEAMKMAGLSKVRAKFQSPLLEAQQLQAQNKQPQPEAKPAAAPQMRTLTNAQVPTAPRPMSRRERAIAAFQRNSESS